LSPRLLHVLGLLFRRNQSVARGCASDTLMHANGLSGFQVLSERSGNQLGFCHQGKCMGMMTPSIALYVWGIWCGIALFEKVPRHMAAGTW